jgi:hypothetical protein
MSKIIQFNKGNEEEHSCPVCDLAFEYMNLVVDAESPEQLFEMLSELIHEAMDLGVISYLHQEISHKEELLDRLTYSCCDEECDCDCEE